MIITGATRDKTRLTACCAPPLGPPVPTRRWIFFISFIAIVDDN